MSNIVREHIEEILEELEILEEEIQEKDTQLAEKNEYIEQLTSARWYVDVAVAVLFAYLYGAWFGVYMCSK